MKRRYFQVLVTLCMAIIFSTSSMVYAATPDFNVSTNPSESTSGGISINSVNPPTNTVDLSTYGQMEFHGKAQGSGLYLNNAFTGVTSIKTYVENYHSQTLTVKLYRETLLGHTCVDTFTYGSGVIGYHYTYDLDSDKTYYLYFEAPSDFSGFVEEY